HTWGLARAYEYFGAVAGSGRDFASAARFFEETVSRSREIGNRQLESLALMNLGISYDALAERARALDYYQQSADVYQQTGDERRAAEAEVNVANLMVTYGGNQADARR